MVNGNAFPSREPDCKDKFITKDGSAAAMLRQSGGTQLHSAEYYFVVGIQHLSIFVALWK